MTTPSSPAADHSPGPQRLGVAFRPLGECTHHGCDNVRPPLGRSQRAAILRAPGLCTSSTLCRRICGGQFGSTLDDLGRQHKQSTAAKAGRSASRPDQTCSTSADDVCQAGTVSAGRLDSGPRTGPEPLEQDVELLVGIVSSQVGELKLVAIERPVRFEEHGHLRFAEGDPPCIDRVGAVTGSPGVGRLRQVPLSKVSVLTPPECRPVPGWLHGRASRLR